MPSWNSNTITIEGPAEKIRALWAAAEAGEDSGLLNAMIPMPRELLAGDGWYGWAVSNWGTNWDVSTEGLELIPGDSGRDQITGWIYAWSPPLTAFRAYAAANEDVYLEIKYFEPDGSFVGIWHSEGGNALEYHWEDVGGLLKTTAEEDAVLYDLLEHFNVRAWYDTDEENLEIDLDGGLSAINEN